jgi:hypothetical protein
LQPFSFSNTAISANDFPDRLLCLGAAIARNSFTLNVCIRKKSPVTSAEPYPSLEAD